MLRHSSVANSRGFDVVHKDKVAHVIVVNEVQDLYLHHVVLGFA